MAGTETSVIEVVVGDAGKTGAHIQISLDLEIGGTSVAEGRAQLNSILGRDPEFITPYLVISAESSIHANELAAGLNAALEAAKTAVPDPTQNALAFALANAVTSDGAIFTPTVTHQGENVVIGLGLQQELLEQATDMLDTAESEAESLLEQKTHFSFELDIGSTFESILNSNNLVLDLFSALKLRVELGIPENTGSAVNELVSDFGLPEPIQGAIAAATLFRNADLQFKFASLENLPEEVKGLIPPTEILQGQKNMLLAMISEADKKLVQLFGTHGVGKLTIYALGQIGFVKAVISLPGLSKFLS